MSVVQSAVYDAPMHSDDLKQRSYQSFQPQQSPLFPSIAQQKKQQLHQYNDAVISEAHGESDEEAANQEYAPLLETEPTHDEGRLLELYPNGPAQKVSMGGSEAFKRNCYSSSVRAVTVVVLLMLTTFVVLTIMEFSPISILIDAFLNTNQ